MNFDSLKDFFNYNSPNKSVWKALTDEIRDKIDKVINGESSESLEDLLIFIEENANLNEEERKIFEDYKEEFIKYFKEFEKKLNLNFGKVEKFLENYKNYKNIGENNLLKELYSEFLVENLDDLGVYEIHLNHIITTIDDAGDEYENALELFKKVTLFTIIFYRKYKYIFKEMKKLSEFFFEEGIRLEDEEYKKDKKRKKK
ncbi:hypothetical protein BLD25_04055 [Candidatus Gracilibacteria bacterium GN02-872]|nr:hypothetical protein BLD25_04055 [Candidatus Gracilibacteria bacterium GN02-872]